MKEFAEIAIALPIEHAFTYSVPEELRGEARLGKRVLIPFGRRTITGYILGLSSSPPEGVSAVKPIIDILDSVPLFDEKRLKFLKWVSTYYFAPLGEVLSLTHPGAANIRSSRTLKAVQSGAVIENPFALELFEAAKKGTTLASLSKRFKNRPVFSTVAGLKKKGLLIEEENLRGGGTIKSAKFVSAIPGLPSPVFKNSKTQEKVYSYLLANGESTLSCLTDALGEARDAVSRLAEKGLVIVEERQVMRDPISEITARDASHTPNEEQAKAIAEIKSALSNGGFSPFLLYGVTGSGKTLVYLKILEEAVRLGRKAIILAPEIALTPWPAAYLKTLFPGRVALAHSGLSEGERMDEWGRVLNGEADIVVGARSALFSPVKDLGLIIVDEEHETSYKQEDGVRYNARDAALVLGKELGITVVLGSATPSIETFQNAKTGKLKALNILKRVDSRGLPEVEILDMKGSKDVLSPRLISLMAETLEAGRQTVLFLNRRGFSSCLICRDCGHSFTCLNCSVSLTLHKGARSLVCHYCDLTMPAPHECPSCSGIDLITPGSGTERVEEEVLRLFPGARVGRLDRDTASLKGAARRTIEDMDEGRLDILIGTQMVSKGHHFPNVTLVGVISGDTSLNIPDFRSSERTFQLITQAAGRSGRGIDAGRVVIQTLNPGHYCLSAALSHDYDSFFSREIEAREELGYPPFTRLCVVRVDGTNEGRVIESINSLKKALGQLSKSFRTDIQALGPAPALVSKVRGRHRWQMLLKGSELKSLHSLAGALKAVFERQKASGVSLTLDMDPLSTV
ncbi:Primosomal protein N' [uncultured bacterium]|nr:Primosomal protein N' [uncultured bacterium]